MSKVKKAAITEEELIAAGWEKTGDPVYIFEKKIDNRNPINGDPDDTDIKLVVHGMYNCWTFAVLFPDGGMLNFVANSMKELNNFERAVNFYDPPF